MKLIIDISEEDYRECKFRKDLLSLGEEPTDLTFNMRMETLIANGTPLEEELENQKTGHWITWKEAGNEIPSETRFECSVCHDSAQTLCNGLDLLSLYCPNCGAKMKGVQE